MKNFYLSFLLILLSKITFSQTEPGCPDSLKITTTVCVTANEVRLTGPFWGWDPTGGPIASDNGDGTWTFTFCPAPAENMQYLLVVDGVQENLVNAPHPDLNGDGFGDLWEFSPITDYFSYANRQWVVGSGNVTNTYATCGSCSDFIYGCTDSIACNYNPDANVSDTCIYPPEQPTLACYEEAFYDPEFCEWVVNGDMPEAPPVECYQTLTFNADTCVWVVSGAQTVVTDTVSSVGSYEWSINGVTYDSSGTYTFIAPDSVCITFVLIFTSTAGINEELSSQINLFPNPTSGNVIISFPMNEEGNLSVYDTQGKLVLSSALNSGDEINLSNQAPGVYTFKINLNDKIHIQRIIKN